MSETRSKQSGMSLMLYGTSWLESIQQYQGTVPSFWVGRM